MTVGAVADGRRGTLFLTEVGFWRADEQLGGRGIHGSRFPSLLPVGLVCLCLAGLVLTSCTRLGEAYAFYNAHVDREVVAGHDDTRGNYAEVRFSPHRKTYHPEAKERAATGGTPLGQTADAAARSNTSDGKAVAR